MARVTQEAVFPGREWHLEAGQGSITGASSPIKTCGNSKEKKRGRRKVRGRKDTGNPK